MAVKVVLIAGASSGIGLELAKQLINQEYHLILCSRNIEQIESLKRANTELVKMDVADEMSVDSVFNFVKSKYGRLDILVNCAGFVDPKSLQGTELEMWQKTIDVNLTGTFLTCRAASFLMREHGGKIINISSTAGLSPRPGWSAYAAAKSGVINFTLAIADELKEYGIRTFVICPGRTATPLRKILAPEEDPTTIMQPNQVVEFILMCMHEGANVIEGQPIIVRDRF